MNRIPSSLYVFLLSTTIFAASAVAVSQTPQPPPPMIRDNSAKPPFESKEGGFRIAFPAKPTEQSRDSETSFGKTTMRTYSLATSLAGYSLVHIDFPTAIKDKFDLDVRFDAMRDGQLKRMKDGRLLSENEWYFGSNYGREFVIADETVTHWIRTVVVEQRLFVIGVDTPGNYAGQSAALKSATESRVKKFFDSFAVTEIPKPTMTAVELPEDFGITVSGSTVSSSFLEISFEMPKGWVVLENAETDLLFELGKQQVSKTKPKLVEHIRSANGRLIFGASKSSLETAVTGGVMLVAVERAPYPNFLALAVAKTYANTFLDRTEKLVKEPAVQQIGGVEFAWVEIFDSDTKTHHRLYFANRKGVSLQFSLTSPDPAGLDVMVRALQSLKAK